MKKIGKEKRDILVSRLQSGQKAQEEAKKQFQTTLEAFQELTGFDGGDLEKVHKKLNGELEDAEDRARKVHDRIEGIDKVGNDLFKEWSKEISGMWSAGLREQSEGMLRETQKRHDQYLRRMRQTEEKMTPVLRSFRDQVTFLKHNLNAKAITSLKKTSARMDTDVADLIKDIEASMKEADSFISTLKKDSES
jgi:ElaB/YqjD/DUF883 family membrane-anchored ribosome-binding protein